MNGNGDSGTKENDCHQDTLALLLRRTHLLLACLPLRRARREVAETACTFSFPSQITAATKCPGLDGSSPE